MDDDQWDEYAEATKGLSGDDIDSFNAYLIGALSAVVPKREWFEAMKIARKCLREWQKRKSLIPALDAPSLTPAAGGERDPGGSE